VTSSFFDAIFSVFHCCWRYY